MYRGNNVVNLSTPKYCIELWSTNCIYMARQVSNIYVSQHVLQKERPTSSNKTSSVLLNEDNDINLQLNWVIFWIYIYLKNCRRLLFTNNSVFPSFSKKKATL